MFKGNEKKVYGFSAALRQHFFQQFLSEDCKNKNYKYEKTSKKLN
jgi:hypothetical protein